MIIINNKNVKNIKLKDNLTKKDITVNNNNCDVYVKKKCDCVREISNGQKIIRTKNEIDITIYPKNEEDFKDGNIPIIMDNNIEVEYENGNISTIELDGYPMINEQGIISLKKDIIIK